MNADKELDTRGLNCPLPILKAKKALADMASGEATTWCSKTTSALNSCTTCAAAERCQRLQRESERQRLDPIPKARPQCGVLQSQFHVGFQESFLAAAVVASAFVAIGKYFLAPQ